MLCNKQVVKMCTQSSVFCNKQVKDEKLLTDKVYFLNKSRTKYLVVGLSVNLQFQPVIKICSMKSKRNVLFTKQEWVSFWTKEGIFANYLTFQNTFPEAMWENGKSYSFEKIDQGVVLKIADVSCADEVYIGKESFWTLQEVRPLVNIVLDEFESFNFQKAFEDIFSKCEGTISNNVGKVLFNLEHKKSTLPFLLYYTLKEVILNHPDSLEKICGPFICERSD